MSFEEQGRSRLIVEIRPDKRCKPVCSGCDKPAACYDRMPTTRYFQFPPLWGLLVFFAYVTRRVDCPRSGTVKVELSWKQVAGTFRSSWDTVYRSVQLAVEWGLEHRDLTGIHSIGVDEVAWHRGQAAWAWIAA